MALGNEDLTWETTNTLDVGFELEMFDRLIYLKASYYNKLTTDLINDVTIPTSTGFSTYKENIGEVSNKGYEIYLTVNPIRTKDWNLMINANLAHNKNKIEKISESLKAYNEKVKAIYDKNYGSGDDSYEQNLSTMPLLQYEEGSSMNSIWGVQSLGINPADGREVYVDKYGNPQYAWRSGDQVVVGSDAPTIQGSIGFNLTYKRFSLYTSFMYEYGGQVYNRTLLDKIENVDVYNNNVDSRVATDRWQKPGDVSMFKGIQPIRGSENKTQPTSRFIQDYNILSLSSIELSYEMPSELISKANLSVLTFTIGSNDLFRLSTVKMERGLSYPFARTINFSIRASF